jgi:uncharacterized protein
VFIDIEDLRQEQLQVHHVYPLAALRLDHPDAALSQPVRTGFVLAHKENDLHISGSVETAIRYKCSRCLKECELPVESSFELLYLPQPKWLKVDEDIELKYEDMDIAYYDGVRFDVDLMIIEQIELSMPMKFVCRPDCKGLCFNCGIDLNENVCTCAVRETDSRFAALLEFRKKTEE